MDSPGRAGSGLRLIVPVTPAPTVTVVEPLSELHPEPVGNPVATETVWLPVVEKVVVNVVLDGWAGGAVWGGCCTPSTVKV